MKDKKNMFLFMIIFITLIAMCLGMEYYTTKVNELENSLEILQGSNTKRCIFFLFEWNFI